MSDLYIFGYNSSTIDISSAIVTLGTSLTYNGSEQTQTVSVMVKGKTLTENTDYTITDNTATNAGSYTLSILGTGAYSGIKTVNWSIAKAQGSISIDPSSLAIVGANSTGTATITGVGDGTISAISSDTSVATASVSGHTVTVTGVAGGDATVTVTLADGQNYLGSSIGVSVMVISSTLAENSPKAIQYAAQAGIASTLWNVGAKTANISIGSFSGIAATTNVAAFIIGFDHNSSKEGTNRIHFQFGKIGTKDVAFYALAISNGNKNSGGWNSSNMRTTHCPAFKSALPSAWQNAIAATTKYTDNTGGGSDTASYVTATTDDIFLLAEYEVFGSRSEANSAEQNYQAQYQYYINGNSKIKYRHNATSSDCCWWLRSPNADSSGGFCNVDTNGRAWSDPISLSFGFAPGFSIA